MVIVLSIIVFGCDDDSGTNSDHYEYFDAVPIDTILLGETFVQEELLALIYHYPEGCNNIHNYGYTRTHDTLDFTVVLRFYYLGEPCAHGPGTDTVWATIDLDQSGVYVARYRNAANDSVVMPFSYETR
jgi:hypothetical protein